MPRPRPPRCPGLGRCRAAGPVGRRIGQSGGTRPFVAISAKGRAGRTQRSTGTEDTSGPRVPMVRCAGSVYKRITKLFERMKAKYRRSQLLSPQRSTETDALPRQHSLAAKEMPASGLFAEVLSWDAWSVVRGRTDTTEESKSQVVVGF